MSAVFRSMPPLTVDEQTMVDENLGLIRFVIQKRCLTMLTSAYDGDDAWQDGYIGLCRAAEKYDPGIAKFSTYACQWIYAGVQRGADIVAGRSFRTGLSDGNEASIDEAMPGANGLTRGDLLAAVDTDPFSHVEARRLAGVLASHCRDDEDRAAAAWLLGAEDQTVLAALIDVPRSTLSYRAKRLRRLLAEEAAA